MYEYNQNGNGYTTTQRVRKVTVEEKFEDGKLVSKTTTTEYVDEPVVRQPLFPYAINVTNTDRIGEVGKSTGPHTHIKFWS